MIVKITQTASNIKQEYDIEREDHYLRGKAGSVSRFQNIVMSGADVSIEGKYHVSSPVNYIPFRYLFGAANQRRNFCLYRDGEKYGDIFFIRHGFLKSFYMIDLDDGTDFCCYVRLIDSFSYISIYRDRKQIALVETLLSNDDYKFVHKLYILKQWERYADTLAFFVLYYANFCFTRRFHMSMGSVTVKRARSFSDYNHKYDPSWRETHFPDDNYFGKLHVFD